MSQETPMAMETNPETGETRPEVWTAPGTPPPAARAPQTPPAASAPAPAPQGAQTPPEPVPWRQMILDAVTVADLTDIHTRYKALFTTAEGLQEFTSALTRQKTKIEDAAAALARAQSAPTRQERAQGAGQSGGQTARSLSTAAPIIERLLDDHVAAINAYEAAATAAARADADYKAEYAKRYLEHRSHAEVKTVAEAEYRTDSDPAVTEARFQRGVTEGLERAARFRVENIEKRLDYWRSIMVAERHLDESERSRR